MAEGFFPPSGLSVPGISSDRLCGSMVRVLPKTLLVLDMASDADDAQRRARNESLPDGSECWYRFFTRDDLAKVDDPKFAMGMVRHEFACLVRAGATFPSSVPLDGGGSGFAISPRGHVLTNYHLVTSEVANYGREQGVLNSEVPCRSLRAQVAYPRGDGTHEWRDADAVWLVSNPSTARALEKESDGLLHPREDTALLRVDPPPRTHVTLSDRLVTAGERVWMAGFPIRSARDATRRERLGYPDADGSLRISAGEIKTTDRNLYFSADLDGSMGNSGSAVFDENGLVVGMFSRATGQGELNAFEYGHVDRVQVTAALAIAGLGLDQALRVQGEPLRNS